MIATRRALETIGMNTIAGSPATRRSARLSADIQGEEESPKKKSRKDPATSATAEKRPKKRKDYDEESDGFVFTKSKRAKASRAETAQAGSEQQVAQRASNAIVEHDGEHGHKTANNSLSHKTRRRLPASPERRSPIRTARRPAEKSDEPTRSPFKPAHAEAHNRATRDPSPLKALNVEKKRRKQGDIDQSRTSRIALPASDTPIIRRNKAMRHSVANGDRRRSSTGFRGKRVSSLMDEGKWNALPHSDVVASEFHTIIPPELTEPRRMRLLLGWCGDRALPPKAQAPLDSAKEALEDFQAAQAARVIQEELSKELSSNGSLSEWFSRDIEAPPPKVVLRKKPNPRNKANAAKAEELEVELERLKLERKAWHDVTASADHLTSHSEGDNLSPLHPDLLPSPQRAIFDQFKQYQDAELVTPNRLQQRLQDVSLKLEYTVDSFAHGVHALNTTRQLAERAAHRTASNAAQELEKREQERLTRDGERKLDTLDALRGLAKALNGPG